MMIRMLIPSSSHFLRFSVLGLQWDGIVALRWCPKKDTSARDSFRNWSGIWELAWLISVDRQVIDWSHIFSFPNLDRVLKIFLSGNPQKNFDLPSNDCLSADISWRGRLIRQSKQAIGRWIPVVPEGFSHIPYGIPNSVFVYERTWNYRRWFGFDRIAVRTMADRQNDRKFPTLKRSSSLRRNDVPDGSVDRWFTSSWEEILF
jgi:hypothetical protein